MISFKRACSSHNVLQGSKRLGKIKDKPQKALVVMGEENIQPAGIVNVNSSMPLSLPIAVFGTATESE